MTPHADALARAIAETMRPATAARILAVALGCEGCADETPDSWTDGDYSHDVEGRRVPCMAWELWRLLDRRGVL